jgi:hypothetical protein
MKESNRSLIEGFQSFKESFVKVSSGSKKKGEQGEMVFQDIIQRAFGSVSCSEYFDIESVGKEGHQGDLRMIWKGHKILLEVKNYERSVDDKEVKKFLRDMEEGSDVSLGIMVSLTSGIVGHTKTGGVDIVELRDGRFCLYLTNFLSHLEPVLFLQGLKPFMETFLAVKEKQSGKEKDTSISEAQIERFEVQRSILLKLLQNHLESTRKFKNTIQNAKKKQEQMWLEIGVEQRESEYQVKLLLETLLEVNTITESTTNQEYATEALQLPSYIFRNTELEYYTEKEKCFLKELLANFEISEEYVCGKKDIKDTLKNAGYTEDSITKLCERLFLEDVWEKGKQKVKYFKKRII